MKRRKKKWKKRREKVKKKKGEKKENNLRGQENKPWEFTVKKLCNYNSSCMHISTLCDLSLYRSLNENDKFISKS